jgi:GT2 family glycosyltransferase
LGEIVAAAEARPWAAGFTGPVVDNTPAARRFALLHSFMQSISELDHVAQCFEYAGQTMIGTIGANLAVRRRWYDDVGGFDTSFRYPGGEDYDLGLRIQQASGKIEFLEDAVVHHVYPRNVRHLIARWLTYGRGKARFGIKHGIPFYELNIVCRRRRDLLLKSPFILATAQTHFPQFAHSGLLRKAVIIFVEYLFQLGALAELRALNDDNRDGTDVRQHSASSGRKIAT